MKHIEIAFRTPNQWWKYPVVFFVGVFLAQFIGFFPALIIFFGRMIEDPNISFESLTNLTLLGYSKNFNLFMLMIPFAVTLILSILMIKAMHKRGVSQIINGTKKVRWNKVFFGFIVWLVLLGIGLGIDLEMNPDTYKFQFEPSKFIILVLISLLLIPIQTTSEEYLFRGYLFQGFGSLFKNAIPAIIFPALIFGLLHIANPEVSEYGFWVVMPQYVLFGVVFGLLTALDDGMEIAIGTHAANNIFLSIFFTEGSAVFQTDALFFAEKVDPEYSLISFIIFSAIFIGIMQMKYKFDWKVLTKKIVPPAITDENSPEIIISND